MAGSASHRENVIPISPAVRLQERLCSPKDPLVETHIKSGSVASTFVWIKDPAAMKEFVRAFRDGLQERKLLVIMDSPQTDPHTKYSTVCCFEVHLPAGPDKRESEDLAIVSVYKDDKERMVMKINPASSMANEFLIPAISPALARATGVPTFKIPIVFTTGTFDFDTAEPHSFVAGTDGK